MSALRPSFATLLALSCACGAADPSFSSSQPFLDAELVAFVVTVDGRPGLDRSQLWLPRQEPDRVASFSLEAEESLLALRFGADALARGVGQVRPLARADLRLLPAGTEDCGPQGEVQLPSAGDDTRVRQRLQRFEPELLEFHPEDETPQPGLLSDFPSVGALELEVPVELEPCRAELGLELRPFTEGGVFPTGVDVSGQPQPESYHQELRALWPAGGDRWFALSYGSIYHLRRGVPFDPAQDARFKITETGLPGNELGRWFFWQMGVRDGPAPSEHRLVVMVRRVDLGLHVDAGWALIELPFDGTRFAAPTIRWLVENEPGQSGAAFHMHERGGLAAVGGAGTWAVSTSTEAPFVGGRNDRGDMEAVLVTGHPRFPHAVGLRGGTLGLGDLAAPGGIPTENLRMGASVTRLAVGVDDAEGWLYTGWKDGDLFRSRIDTRTILEPLDVTLPPRFASCAGPSAPVCGRYSIIGDTLGLHATRGPKGQELLLGLFEGCTNLVVYEVASGCTTAVEFPRSGFRGYGQYGIHEHDGVILLTDGEGEPYELRIGQ